jgi:hypothetical protein
LFSFKFILLPILGWLFTSQGFWGKIVPCLGGIELRDSRQKIGKNEGGTKRKKERKKEETVFMHESGHIYDNIFAFTPSKPHHRTQDITAPLF